MEVFLGLLFAFAFIVTVFGVAALILGSIEYGPRGLIMKPVNALQERHKQRRGFGDHRFYNDRYGYTDYTSCRCNSQLEHDYAMIREEMKERIPQLEKSVTHPPLARLIKDAEQKGQDLWTKDNQAWIVDQRDWVTSGLDEEIS